MRIIQRFFLLQFRPARLASRIDPMALLRARV